MNSQSLTVAGTVQLFEAIVCRISLTLGTVCPVLVFGIVYKLVKDVPNDLIGAVKELVLKTSSVPENCEDFIPNFWNT